MDEVPDALRVVVELLHGTPVVALLTEATRELRVVYGNAAWEALTDDRARLRAPIADLLDGPGAEPVLAAMCEVARSGGAARLRRLRCPGRLGAGVWSCDIARCEGDHRSYVFTLITPQLDLGGGDGRMTLLTRRERDVARLVSEGLDNVAIGKRLGLGRTTVATHVGDLLAKLGFSSRVQVAVWMVEQRLGSSLPTEQPAGGARQSLS